MRQYANSPTIQSVVEDVNEYFNAEKYQKDFYDKIWNVDTASTYGLDIWGRIVDIGRYLTITGNQKAFGFEVVDNAWTPFDNAPFWTNATTTETYRLEDKAYYTLIIAKAMANIFGRSASSVNDLMAKLFEGRGNSYVLDNNDMTIRYVFEFELEPYERAIVHNEKIFARPAGVLAEVKVMPSDTFGFAEADDEYEPFGEGIFYND